MTNEAPIGGRERREDHNEARTLDDIDREMSQNRAIERSNAERHQLREEVSTEPITVARPETVPRSPDRLWRLFRREFRDRLSFTLDIPSDERDMFEYVVRDQFLDPLYHQWSQQALPEIHNTRVTNAETMEDMLEGVGRENQVVLSQFIGDQNANESADFTGGTSLMERAAAFLANNLANIIPEKELGGARRISRSNLMQLHGILIAAAPNLLERENSYINLMNIISTNDELNEQQIESLISQIQDYENPLSTLNETINQAQSHGAGSINVTPILEAGSLFNALNANQRVQLINHILSNYSPERSSIIVDLAAFSSQGLTPRRVISMIQESGLPNTEKNRLEELIREKSATAQRLILDTTNAIIASASQNEISNAMNEGWTPIAAAGTFLAGLTALVNIAIGTVGLVKRNGTSAEAFGIAGLSVAAGSAGVDHLMGRQIGETATGFVENLLTSREQVRTYNSDRIREALNTTWLRMPSTETLAALQNENLIRIVRENYAQSSETGEFSANAILQNLETRAREIGGQEGQNLAACAEQIRTHFRENELTGSERDNAFFLLGHAFHQLDISDGVQMQTRVYEPESISIPEEINQQYT